MPASGFPLRTGLLDLGKYSLRAEPHDVLAGDHLVVVGLPVEFSPLDVTEPRPAAIWPKHDVLG